MYRLDYRRNLGYRPPQFGQSSQYNQTGQYSQGGMPGYSVVSYGQNGIQGANFSPQFASQGNSFQGHGFGISAQQGNHFQGSQPQAFITYPTAPQAAPFYSGPSVLPPLAGVHCSTAPAPSAFQLNEGSYPAVPPTISVAAANSSAPNSEVPWFFDSGASAHVTNNLSQISAPINNAPTSVTVGNGQTVPVSHSGLSNQPKWFIIGLVIRGYFPFFLLLANLQATKCWWVNTNSPYKMHVEMIQQSHSLYPSDAIVGF